MAGIQNQAFVSSAAAAAAALAEPERLHPPYIRPTCARCVQRVILDPSAFCLLQEPSERAIKTHADVKCKHCHNERARCWKCPSELEPEIYELQRRSDDLVAWQYAQSVLPLALRSTWVLPTNHLPPAVYNNWPADVPEVYKALHKAQRVVNAKLQQKQATIQGWSGLSKIQKNQRLKLDPVVRDGGDHGYWW